MDIIVFAIINTCSNTYMHTHMLVYTTLRDGGGPYLN